MNDAKTEVASVATDRLDALVRCGNCANYIPNESWSGTVGGCSIKLPFWAKDGWMGGLKSDEIKAEICACYLPNSLFDRNVRPISGGNSHSSPA